MAQYPTQSTHQQSTAQRTDFQSSFSMENKMEDRLISEIHGITIDYTRDSLLDDAGKIRLRESYMKDDETSPQERFAFVSKTFSSNPEHAQRLYDYSSQHWLSYATPILSYGRSKRGLPISCFLNYIPDSRGGITDHYTENAWLSSAGGGIGGYWGALRLSLIHI